MKSYQSYDDGTLVRLLSQSEEGAFTELYNRYWKQMVTLAYVKLGNTSDAKEVVQEVYVDFWNRREKLQIQTSFETYLAGSVKFQIIRFLSRANRRNEVEEHAPLNQKDTSTQDWLDYQALKEVIEASVSQLPSKCQLVYRLSREQGLSLPEIAGELNISPKTAEAHLTKALKTVRGSLGSSFGLFHIFL